MLIKVSVVLRSKANAIEKISDNEFKVRITSAPVENKANLAVIKILSKELKIPKTLIQIAKGAKSKNKIIEIPD